MKLLGLSCVLTCLASLPAAQGNLLPACAAPEHLPLPIRSALVAWRVRHGCDWQLVHDRIRGQGRMLLGGGAAAPFVPQDDAERFALARYWIAEAYELLRVDVTELVDDRWVPLPLASIGTTDKFSVRLRQEVGGVPVQDASVNVLFEASTATLLSIDSTVLPDLTGFDARPSVDPRSAEELAAAAFESSVGRAPERVGVAALAIEKQRVHGMDRPRLVWQVDVAGTRVDGSPASVRYHVAASGPARVVSATDGMLHAAPQQAARPALRGRVLGNVTADGDGTSHWPWIDRVSPNHVLVPLAHVTVRNTAGTFETTTDEHGEFAIPPGFATTVTVELSGPFVEQVLDEHQPRLALTRKLTSPFTDLILNPAPGELDVAEVNAFYRMNQTRDWVRSVNPFDDTADERAPGLGFRAIVNTDRPCGLPTGGQLTAQCNASYDVFSDRIHFSIDSANFPHCSGSGCPNASFAPLIWHELGHWLTQRYGNAIANPADQPQTVRAFHEGVADAFALYQLDYPLLRYGTIERSGENTRQFCGDCESQQICHAPPAPHVNGQPLMGALWKVRARLEADFGGAGDSIADALFLSWMNAYDQNRIHSILLYQWLALDDDDHDLSTPSPHFAAIESGLLQQGFPAFSLPVRVVICP